MKLLPEFDPGKRDLFRKEAAVALIAYTIFSKRIARAETPPGADIPLPYSALIKQKIRERGYQPNQEEMKKWKDITFASDDAFTASIVDACGKSFNPFFRFVNDTFTNTPNVVRELQPQLRNNGVLITMGTYMTMDPTDSDPTFHVLVSQREIENLIPWAIASKFANEATHIDNSTINQSQYLEQNPEATPYDAYLVDRDRLISIEGRKREESLGAANEAQAYIVQLGLIPELFGRAPFMERNAAAFIYYGCDPQSPKWQDFVMSQLSTGAPVG